MLVARKILLRFVTLSIFINLCFVLFFGNYPDLGNYSHVLIPLVLLSISYLMIKMEVISIKMGFVLVYLDIALRYFFCGHDVLVLFFEMLLLFLIGLIIFSKRENSVLSIGLGVAYCCLVYFGMLHTNGNTIAGDLMLMFEFIVFGLFGASVLLLYFKQIEMQKEQSFILTSRLRVELDEIIERLEFFTTKCDELQVELNSLKLKSTGLSDSPLVGNGSIENPTKVMERKKKEEDMRYGFYLYAIKQMRAQLPAIKSFIEMQKKDQDVRVLEVENNLKILNEALHELSVKVSFDCIDAGVELTANEYYFFKNFS